MPANKEYNDAYYETHRDELLAKVKAKRLDNLVFFRARDKAYFDELKATNPIRILDKNAICYDNNKEHRDWYRQNKRVKPTVSKCREYYANRRANPEKVEQDRVASQSYWLVNRGDIKLTPCIVCGSTENIMLFHRDYDDPMNVDSMCRKHCYEANKHRNRLAKIAKLNQTNEEKEAELLVIIAKVLADLAEIEAKRVAIETEKNSKNSKNSLTMGMGVV